GSVLRAGQISRGDAGYFAELAMLHGGNHFFYGDVCHTEYTPTHLFHALDFTLIGLPGNNPFDRSQSPTGVHGSGRIGAATTGSGRDSHCRTSLIDRSHRLSA